MILHALFIFLRAKLRIKFGITKYFSENLNFNNANHDNRDRSACRLQLKGRKKFRWIFGYHLVRLLQHDGVVTISNMSDGVYEKDHIMAMSLLSAVAGESIFLLGPTETL